MSGLQARGEESINGVDVRDQGNTLRVATNTPHLVSLGTGRLSTAVTLHPIKQGRVTVGSDPTCDIYVVGTGVASVHCRVENSHGVVTLYPVAGSTLVDSTPVDKPTRLSQGSMLTIGRSNYLRFNHPAEAMLMKSVLPSARRDHTAGYVNVTHTDNSQCYQPNKYKDLSQADHELDITLKELSRTKPPVAPKDEKLTSIMSKVSKFEYYAKQQKNVGRSQFYTNTESEISPKVFSSNSLTVNTPAKDVLGGKTIPNYMKKDQKVVINDNNSVDPRSCSYANVAIRNNTKIGDIVKNFDEKLPKKVNNDVMNIDKDKSNVEIDAVDYRKETKYQEYLNKEQSEGSRSYKDTSLEISKINYSRNQDYSRTKQEFLRNNQVPKNQDFVRINQDLSNQVREHELSRSYQGSSNFTRNQERTESSSQEHKGSGHSQERLTDRTQKYPESSRNHERPPEPSRSQDRCAEEASRSPMNGVGIPRYSPVYANQYERAESMRVKAYQERVKEEEKKEAEMERLEEILDIFTEYQKQLSTDYRPGMPITPTEKRSHNKIITNGSLPRSVAFNNPNFVQTSEGYYKFETSQSRNELPQSLPRNVSSYENFEPAPPTPEVTIPTNDYENVGRMDEIGIPVFDDIPNYEPKSPINISSPIYERKNEDIGTSHNNTNLSNTSKVKPMGSPYENVYTNRTVYNNLKPKSPNTNSPRTRIKTSFAHKNLPSPQYFIFPTPSVDKKQDQQPSNNKDLGSRSETKTEKVGIEKQLSLEEDIPMIDDAELTNDIEFRYSKIIKNDSAGTEDIKSFDDVKKELMADIPELEAFENDLKNHKRDKVRNITGDIKSIDMNVDNSVFDVNIDDLKTKYERLKEERRKLVTEIHEVKCKMTEITSHEDDILRELEMEKALIKGEYDSEIAILKIEQKKKTDLVEHAKGIEEELKQVRARQETRQNEMRDRVEVATLKVERLEKDLRNGATLEELQNAQDILDNESKIYEDLEFQHLEEESELLSNREDLQNEIILLTKKIDAQKTRILTLKSEANNNLTSALDETKVLHTEYVKHLTNVEELTAKVQAIEKELKPIVAKLNEIERAQSPDSAFYTDQTRTKSGEFGYSPQSSDTDDIDTKISNFEEHTKELKDKFNSIDQMSQSMTVDIEKRVGDIDSPKSKEKKGFWERNFDSLKRKKKPKSPEKVDMSQSLNENLFYNNEIIENDSAFDRFGSLRHSKKKDKNTGPIKSNSSSKIPTFAALGKIIKKDSFGKRSKDDEDKPRFIKNGKPSDNKYKSKSLSPDKVTDKIAEETEDDNVFLVSKVLHRKSCGDEPNTKDSRISDSGKIPSQDDIDRISKVTFDAPVLSSDTDVNSLGKRTLDSLMEIERKRFEMLEEQGCQMIENEREKISELKRRAQDETKKLWDQKYREKSVDSDFNSLTDVRRNSCQSIDSKERLSGIEPTYEKIVNPVNFDRNEKSERTSQEKTVAFDRTSENERHNEMPARSVFERSSHDKTARFNQPESLDRSKFDRSVNFDRSVLDKFERSVNFDQSVTDRHERQDMLDFDRSMEFDRSGQFDRSINAYDQSVEDSSLIEDGFMVNSTIFEENSGLISSSIEELQVRNSRTESTEDEKRSDDSRPLSHASDFSRDNILSLSNAPRRSRRGVAPHSESQRPLTRYLPVDRDDFDLRRHVESAGHQIDVCPYVTVTAGSCRGYLHKLGAKFHTWSKRWFVFDRETKTFIYYWDKSEKKPRGGAYFQVIEEVYLDHGNTSKSPSPQTTFIVKTRQRRYYLMAPSGEAARIWIDAIFTGAQGYTEYLE